MAASPLFVPVLAALIGLGAMFFNLVRGLPALWMTDEYYSHGFLIPILAGYVVWQRWPRLRELPARSGWAALILLIPLVLITRAAILSDIPQ
ncbi:MAG: exosortase/archaeosortase family protein [Fimbriimonas ginsengisoli]|uniref:Exosortase/archaeosortase family protein n=1 Tax=Fimbriimonas ginsengisoli TaxID=1005039 RepID=A0A931PW18_FIMGI|nr:exosortase/archaeosortase family protein [Fimbriimonas ginsengisoli]